IKTETSQIEETPENNSSTMEDINSESSSLEKENIETLSVETLDNSNKENFTTDNMQLETTIEIKDTNSLKILIA
ncbi:7951_t:CDS:2, partial [Scutellospora calospora]